MNNQSKHLIIDGYNIIYAWPDISKKFYSFKTDILREQLSNLVRIIHDVESIRVTIIFDGKGNQIEIERPSKEFSFSFIFSPYRTSADGIIEQLINTSKEPKKIILATNDKALINVILKSGCVTLNSTELKSWISFCQSIQSKIIKEKNKRSKMKWKINNLWNTLH